MKHAPRVMILDMDGTVTLPAIDFDRVRAEIGISEGTILEALADMPPNQRQRGMDIIQQHERLAAEDSVLREEVHEVIDELRRRRIAVAIATRNSRASVNTVLTKHGFTVDHVHTRDDGPVKPSPEPVLAVCRYFGVQAQESWIVGDYLYDIQSGRRAGATTVLLAADGPLPDYADQADYVICRFAELLDILTNGSTL